MRYGNWTRAFGGRLRDVAHAGMEANWNYTRGLTRFAAQVMNIAWGIVGRGRRGALVTQQSRSRSGSRARPFDPHEGRNGGSTRRWSMMSDETETLVTRTGFRFFLRPVTPRDEATLAELFRQVSAEDLRFRFLSDERGSSAERFAQLMSDPAARVTSFLAFDERREVIASATLHGDQAGEHCEVAIMIRAASKERGIGWTLLDYLVGYAGSAGYATVTSIEDRENHQSIALQQQMGFATEPVADEPTLVRVRRRLR